VLVLAAVFCVGLLTDQIRSGSAVTFPLPDGQFASVTAHVTREGLPQYKGSGEIQQRLDLETEEIAGENGTRNAHFGIRATFYSKESSDKSLEESLTPPLRLFHYGERLRFSTTLSRPRNFGDPGVFDYRGYLAENGIAAQASAKAASVEVLTGFAGNHAELWCTHIRLGLVRRVHLLWPAPLAALVDAMLFGDNSLLGRDLLADFQRTGTYHVLVISGLKVGILAVVAFWFLRRLRVPSLAASFLAVFLTVFYALLTGVGVPVWRATLTLALYRCARTLYRKKSVLNIIGVAGLTFLLLDPAALSGASFQLSFLCVLIIAAIGGPILERTTGPLTAALRNIDVLAYDFALPPRLVQLRLDLRMVAGRLQPFPGGKYALRLLAASGRGLLLICDFLAISVVLQIGFVLPMAYYFHRATLVALPANVLAVPLTEIALIACMVALALSYASLWVAQLPVWITTLSLKGLIGSVRWLGAWRIADARVPTPDLIVVVVTAAALVLAMLLVRRRPWLAAMGLASLTACALWICFVPPHPHIEPGVLEVTSIDVGEGDSILLISPQGQSLLVDAGGIPHWMHSEIDIGEDVVSPYLWSRGIHHLDAVAVTHPHADHIGGMRAVLANFHPRELWIADARPNEEMEQLLQEAGQLGVSVISHAAGDQWQSGGLTFRALAPPAEAEIHATKLNDESLVMTVSYRGSTALLEGDAEKATERQVAQQEPSADLLKVAHHGSATSTIPELLAAVHPRYAVISVGRRNVYGHPRREVLERLENLHVKTYRTDMDGAVTFYLDGKTVTPCLGNHR